MNILIIKPSSLGDVVQALPALRVLRQKHPHATIDWLVNEEIADVLAENPYLRTVHLWDRASWNQPRHLLTAIRKGATVIRQLRRARYDIVLDLQGLLRSGLMARSSGAKKIIGFADAREMASLFYSTKVEARTHQMHSVERYVLAAGGDPSQPKDFPIAFSASDRQTVESLLRDMPYDRSKPLVILVPGARWQTKRWPQRNFAALAEALRKSEAAQLGFVGSLAEKELTDRIASMCTCPVMDFSGKTTLRQLACLLKKARLVVGNDSGPIHIAAAVGTPVVALYGPTSPTRTGPYGKQHTVLTSRLPCSPCFKRRCDLDAACMKDISIEDVVETCKRHLSEAARKK